MSQSPIDLSKYRDLKKREKDGAFGKVLFKGLELLSKAAPTVGEAVQDQLSGSTDLKKTIDDTAKNISSPKLSWLSDFIHKIAELAGAAQSFEKSALGKTSDYESQAAPLNTMLGAAALLNEDIKKLQTSDETKKGLLANFFGQIEKLSRMTVALTAQSFKYHRLRLSASDFSYWTETQLVKRRMQQQELVALHNISKEYELDGLQDELVGLLTVESIESNLFNKNTDKIKSDITPLTLPTYSEKLEEQAKKLEELFNKQNTKGEEHLTNEEKLFLKNNQSLLAFLVGVPVEQLQNTVTKGGDEQKFKPERVIALLNYLEKQHLTELLEKREILLKQRLIAEYDHLDTDKKSEIAELLRLNEDYEEQFQKTTNCDSKLVNFAKTLSENKALPKLSDKEIDEARAANKKHIDELQKKAVAESKVLASKALLLSSVSLLIVGGIAITMALGPAAIIPIFVAAAVLGLIAIKLNSKVVMDLSTNIKEFFYKFKKEHKILNVKAELANERELTKPILEDAENTVEMTDPSTWKSNQVDQLEDEDIEEDVEEESQVDEFVLLDETDTSLESVKPDTTEKPVEPLRARSISDAVGAYDMLKKKEKEGNFGKILFKGLDLLSKAAPAVGEVIQDQLGGDTDLKKTIDDAAKGVDSPELSWLGGFIKKIAELAGKAQVFEKATVGKKSDYASQSAPLDAMLGAAALLNEDVKKLQTSDEAKKGLLANVAGQIEKLARMTASLTSQSFKYNRLRQSHNDFSYWTETQLSKRRLQQQELVALNNISKEHKLERLQDELTDVLKVEELESNLFNKNADKVKSDITPLTAAKYAKKLEEQVKKMEELFIKQNSKGKNHLTNDEKLFLKNNESLLAYLANVPVSELQTDASKEGDEQKFVPERVIALMNHLEKRHLSTLLEQRERLIKQRLIAEYDELDTVQKANIAGILRLNEDYEEQFQQTTDSDSEFVDFAKILSENKALPKLSKTEIDEARAANKKHMDGLNKKVVAESKILASKVLLVSSVGLLIAGTIAISMLLGPAAIIPIFVAAAVLGLIAVKLNSHVFKDLSTNIKDFFSKLKKEHRILTVKAELAVEREIAKPVLEDQESTVEMTDPSTWKSKLVDEIDDEDMLEEEVVVKDETDTSIEPVEPEVTDKPLESSRARSISDAVSAYDMLKKKENEGTFGKALFKGLDLLSKAGPVVGEVIQDQLSGDTDLKKTIDDAAKGVDSPELSWLGGFIKKIAELAGKAQAFEKATVGKKSDYAAQSAPLDAMLGAAALLNEDVKKLQTSDEAKRGLLANLIGEIEKFGRMTASLTTQSFKYNRLRQSHNDFSYWTETQLSKRRLQQQELVALNNISKEHKLERLQDELTDVLKVEELESNLFNKNADKVKSDITPLTAAKYAKKLEEQIKKMEELFIKQNSKGKDHLTNDEKLFLKNNESLLAYLANVPVSELQSDASKEGDEQKFIPERVIALMNHLEKQHLSTLLEQRERLIKQRLIAEYDDLDAVQKSNIAGILRLNEDYEEQFQQTTDSDSEFVDFAKILSENKALPKLSKTEIDEARAANKKHMDGLNKKVVAESKILASKVLLLSSVGLLIAGSIAISMLLGPAAIIPIFVAAAVLGLIAVKLNSHVFKDLSTNIKDFFSKLKKEHRILTVKAELVVEREISKPVLEDQENTVEMTDPSTWKSTKEVDEQEEVESELMDEFVAVEISQDEEDEFDIMDVPNLFDEFTDLVANEQTQDKDTAKPVSPTKVTSISDAVSSYSALRKKEQEETFGKILYKGLDLLSKATPQIAQVVQDQLSGDTDLKKEINNAANSIDSPALSGLSGFMKKIAEFAGAAQAFEKSVFGKTEDYATQTAPLNSMLNAAALLNEDVKKLQTEDESKKGLLANFVGQTEKMGRMIASLTSQSLKYNRLRQSCNDFSYWTETQLSKRRIHQQELAALHNISKEHHLEGIQTALGKFTDLESNLFDLNNKKIETDIDTLRPAAYTKKLHEQIKKLGEIFHKSNTEGLDNDEDRAFLENNRELLAFLADVPVDQLQSTAVKEGDEQTFSQERIFAVINYLEKQHLSKTIEQREQLIKQRLIAEFDGLDKAQQAQIADVLSLSGYFEVPFQETTKSTSTFFEWVTQVSRNKALPTGLTSTEIDEARAANKKHVDALKDQVVAESKILASKALLVSSVGLLIAGGIAISLTLGPAAIVPIFVVAVITSIVAVKLNSNVFKDLSTNIKDFFSKFKQEVKILNVKAELVRERELGGPVLNADKKAIETSATPSSQTSTQTADRPQEQLATVAKDKEEVLVDDVSTTISEPQVSVSTQAETTTLTMKEQLARLKDDTLSGFEFDSFETHSGTYRPHLSEKYRSHLQHLKGADIHDLLDDPDKGAAAAA